jgi:cytochrome c
MPGLIRFCGATAFCLLLFCACARKNVSFGTDVEPILEKNCLECHVPGGPGFEASGFDMSNYEALMKGGKYGAFVNPGDPQGSNLMVLVEGRAHPSIRMPHGRGKLDDREIEVLKVWIQEGAKNN